MAHRRRRVRRAVLYIRAVECFRHISDVVRRTSTPRFATVYHSVDWVSSTVDLLFLGESLRFIYVYPTLHFRCGAKGCFVGRIFDAYGPRVLTVPGTVVLTLSIMMTSLSTQLYQYILAQGVLFGVGVGMM